MIGPSQVIRVDREQHAAHDPYTRRPLHDLVWYQVRAPLRARGPQRPAEVPSDAEYHSGFRDETGAQVWLFVRRSPPLADRCGDLCLVRGAA